ncbi:hypothetical protein [Peptostreptococcus anaerobius]|uniref:hypothetical protein n=1 Tax=Peptostreptococcus anaerobius TaxID=1261 RepID=UPI0028FF6B13|nr:hypothetical protein [Peptostreptococcus anaerobius]MDU1598874.1 hypothetical protein [Peptostreptococcus anaerobius]MDU1682523.1 hypothetical protein [Peptostreptococcus anaerobius]
MLNARKRRPLSFSEFIDEHMNEFVELDSYLSRKKLYGVISDVDDLSLTLTHTSKNSTIEGSDENHNLYIPINSIKSIKKL